MSMRVFLITPAYMPKKKDRIGGIPSVPGSDNLHLIIFSRGKTRKPDAKKKSKFIPQKLFTVYIHSYIFLLPTRKNYIFTEKSKNMITSFYSHV